ncbi:MAG: hypothetical protein HZA01_09200 [Nitrospinae bacterium]|nr:hypothetical protein [Nitrospinota bacterium]
MVDIVYSKNKAPIRLTPERWLHIVENHDDLAGYYDEVLQTVDGPDLIIEGYKGALVALRKFLQDKFIAVVYKEVSETDGFIITAYFTNKLKLEKEEILWQRQYQKRP